MATRASTTRERSARGAGIFMRLIWWERGGRPRQRWSWSPHARGGTFQIRGDHHGVDPCATRRSRCLTSSSKISRVPSMSSGSHSLEINLPTFSRGRWRRNVVGVRPGFAMAVGITVWLAGLLVALMLGMGSAYLVVSGVFLSSSFLARLRERRDELLPGEIRREPPSA